MSTAILKHKIYSMTEFKRNSEKIYHELVESGLDGVLVQDSTPYLLIKPLKPKPIDEKKLKKFQQEIKEKILRTALTRTTPTPKPVTSSEVDSVDLL